MSRSPIVHPLHRPQGFLLTRQGNTWSLLYFKWFALRFHSPLGVRLLHFVSLFSHRTSEKYALSCLKHWKPDTTLQSIPTHWIPARMEISLQLPCLLQHVPEGAVPHLQLLEQLEPGACARLVLLLPVCTVGSTRKPATNRFFFHG